MPNQFRPTQLSLGVTLTACAGFVDAIAYIGLGGLFASFMSGASISLGAGIGNGDFAPVYNGVAMVTAFLCGVSLGTALSDTLGRRSITVALITEALLLACSVVLTRLGWSTPTALLPVVAGMGLQNTVLEPASGVRLGTTFITGTLVSLGRGMGRAIYRKAKPWPSAGHALLWCGFVGGAILGAVCHAALGANALLAPSGLIVLMGLLSSLPAPKKVAVQERDNSARERHYLDMQRPFIGPYY